MQGPVIRGRGARASVVRTRRWWVAAVLACSILAVASAPAAAQSENEAQIADEGGDIQRDLPLAERVREETAALNRDTTLQHEPPQPKSEPPERNFSLPIPGDVVLYLLLATLVLCLGIVGYHLYRTYAPGARAWSKRGDQALTVEARPIGAAGEGPLPAPDEIERLARAGAYAEAIHLMLLRALDALRRRLGASWAKSMTSREIARRSELGPSDRQALRMLVGAVEISRFGGQSANEQIYRACLDQYRLLGGEPRNAQA
jgi:Domain of unknown function (DUF4129)